MNVSDHTLQQAKKCVKQKKYSQAIALFTRLLEIQPTNKFALKQVNKLQTIEEKELEVLQQLFTQNKFEEANKKCLLALQKFPESARLHNLKGGLANRLGKLEDAVEAYEKTIDLLGYDTNVLINLGIAYRQVKQIEKSISCFTTILDKFPDHPDARYSLAFTYLLDGNYEKGWELYESRWQATFSTSQPRTFKQPMWDGRSLKGKKIFVHCEQGYGDTFQFIRFLEPLKQLGGHIIFETPMALKPLMFNFEHIDELITRGEAEPDFDLHVPLLSLPFILKIDITGLSGTHPYIKSDGVPFDGLTLNSDTLNVGFVWTGSESFRHNHFRSMVFQDITPLLQAPNCTFHSLQVCEDQERIANLLKDHGINDLGSQFTNFLDTLRAIDQMDLVITTDTSVAHLAGAMGKKTWVLLHYMADFRWLLNRDDSPWYSSVRLFRQDAPGNWQKLLDKVIDALKEL